MTRTTEQGGIGVRKGYFLRGLKLNGSHALPTLRRFTGLMSILQRVQD